MTGIASKIMRRVSERENGGWVCTPKDFLDLGSRYAVDQSLSRLVKAGQLRRLGHGLYAAFRFSDVLNGPAPASLESIIAALTRRDGARIMTDGMVAANLLGLTNAVPAKVIYLTDGHSRTLDIDGRTICFRHAGPNTMKWAGKPAAPVVQALRWLGPRNTVEGGAALTLNRILPNEVKQDLLDNIHDLPGWAVALVREIAHGGESTA